MKFANSGAIFQAKPHRPRFLKCALGRPDVLFCLAQHSQHGSERPRSTVGEEGPTHVPHHTLKRVNLIDREDYLVDWNVYVVQAAAGDQL